MSSPTHELAELPGGVEQRRQRRLAGGGVEAVAGTLHAEDRYEAAGVAEDGGGEGGEVLLALLVGLAPATLARGGNGGVQIGGIRDRAGGEGIEALRGLGLAARAEGEHDFADGRGVRDGGAADEGRGAHAAAARDVVDGDALAGGGEGEGRRLAGLGLEALEDGAGDGAHVEALQDVRAELQQAHAEAVTARRLDSLDEAVAGQRAEQAGG